MHPKATCTKTIQVDDNTHKVTIKTPHLTYGFPTALTPFTRLVNIAKHNRDGTKLDSLDTQLKEFRKHLTEAEKCPQMTELEGNMLKVEKKIAMFMDEFEDVVKEWPKKTYDQSTPGFTSIIPAGTPDVIH
ncbi:MAG: hypothetical protein LQ350_008457 [Teloschistes chrysophthalmus]|nr:MAG: hypothetical protein LQ350_008457 [Niorma chrysophthalma]